MLLVSYEALVFATLLSLAAAQSGCLPVYRRYSSRHTYCLPKNGSCTILNKGVSEQDKQLILKVHNDYRSKVASGEEFRAGRLPSASNMLELVWDDELASVAQKLTETCRYGHDCKPCRQVGRFLVGQNIFRQNGVASNQNPEWQNILSVFYDEIDFFDKQLVDGYEDREVTKDKQYGHFTQMIWADSWRIGCGQTLYQEPIEGTSFFITRRYYACNFGPRGNIINQRIYKDGPTCSDCPPNSCCGDDCASHGIWSQYPGLCKVVNENLPPEGTEPVVKNTLFYCGFMNEPDCDMESVTGKNTWTIFNSNGDNYAEIVLNGGETTTVTFRKRFRSSADTGCFNMLMRRAPNVDGDPYDSSFVSKYVLNGEDYHYFSTNKMSKPAWHSFTHSKYLTNLPENQDVQYSFTFSVSPGAKPQYLNIKRIYIEDGYCNY